MAERMSATARSRSLRRAATDAEALLWKHLRDRGLAGTKFHRQHPIGRYIVDFFCLERALVIEVDGGQHATRTERDQLRDDWLRAQGCQVLRFWNNEVLNNLEGVLSRILAVLEETQRDTK